MALPPAAGRAVSPAPLSSSRAPFGGGTPLLSGSPLNGTFLSGQRVGSPVHGSPSRSPPAGPRQRPCQQWTDHSGQLPRAIPVLGHASIWSGAINSSSLGVASLARAASESFIPGTISHGAASTSMLRGLSPASRDRLDRSLTPVQGQRSLDVPQAGYGSQFMFGRPSGQDRSPSLEAGASRQWGMPGLATAEQTFGRNASDDAPCNPNYERCRSPTPVGRAPLSRSSSPSLRYASQARSGRHHVAMQPSVSRAPSAVPGRQPLDRSVSLPQQAPVGVAAGTPLSRIAARVVQQSSPNPACAVGVPRSPMQRTASPRPSVSPRWVQRPAPWEFQPTSRHAYSGGNATPQPPGVPVKHIHQVVSAEAMSLQLPERMVEQQPIPQRRQLEARERAASPEECCESSRPLAGRRSAPSRCDKTPVRGERTPRAVVGTSLRFQSAQEDLQEGAWIRIGECACQIKKALGMGSFGAVWAAERPTGSEIAVKEIVCHSHAELLNALFESHLLRVLGSEVCPPFTSQELATQPGDDCHAFAGVSGEIESEGMGSVLVSDAPSPRRSFSSGMIPNLVACDTLNVSPDIWRVRLAMSRVNGESLDRFLDRRRYKKDIVPKLYRQYHEACYFARELLVQLVPVFESICAVAFHRDVNSHNILIDVNGPMQPSYGLVDFGLAVDAACWCSSEEDATLTRPSRIGRDGASTWHYLDVGGDCRYWPISAWMQFLAGWRKLEECPSLRFEYKMQLDLHALGITALQVFAEMMPVLTSDSARDRDTADSRCAEWEGVPSEVRTLLRHWERYWGRVSPLHARLINTFHTKGDWDVLKVDCINSGVHESLADDLHKLRTSIRRAAEACRNSASPDSDQCATSGPAGASTFFAALLLLISCGDGESMVSGPPAWQAVRELLASDAAGRCPPFKRKLATSTCSTASSAGGHGVTDSSSRSRVNSSEPTPKGQMSSGTPALLLPRPRLVGQDEATERPRRSSRLEQPSSQSPTYRQGSSLRSSVSPPRAPALGHNFSNTGNIAVQGAPATLAFELFRDQSPGPVALEQKVGGEEALTHRLGDLKEKVDYLSRAMARLGEKRDDINRRSARQQQPGQ